MHLKKIELFGFKSFADKTEVHFERGVTCIVGPNGCGKSNISDSIRWVLGERSAKLLRGSKMEDVIFSGTDFRKPLNVAEVSLTIDNTDQKLPIQYEEVVITRKLHRSGESAYLINKTPCRLKDIQDLILDTGIGSNAYSMIEQGRIDYILNAEAEERRFLIEEAAGISKYKVKKEEALRKLERTEENLIRLNDIVSEVERNIRYAERQAQRAERYKDQLEKLKQLEIQKAFFEINRFSSELNQIEEASQHLESELSSLEEKSSFQNLKANEVEQKLRELEQLFLEQEHARSEVKEELTSIVNHEQFHRERIEFLKLAREKALGEMESLKKRAEHLEGEIQEKQKEQANLKETLQTLVAEQKSRESLFHEIAAHPERGNEECARLQTSLFDQSRQLAETNNLLNKTQLELKALEKNARTLNESRVKLTETRSTLLSRQNQLNEEQKQSAKLFQESKEAAEQAAQNCLELELKLEEKRKELIQQQALKTKFENEFRFLEEIDQATGPDPKKIVAKHGSQLAEEGVIQTLLDVIKIEPGYELAVEAALQDSVRAVVTENLETAVKLLDELKQGGSHRATIFIKDRAALNGSLAKDPEVENHPVVHKKLWNAIQVQKGYEGILGNLLGKVYIVNEITRENAPELTTLAARVKFVSRSGAILGPEYQLSLRNGGYTPEKSVLARREAEAQLLRDIAHTSTEEHKTSSSLQELERAIQEMKEREKELNQKLLAHQAAVERFEGTHIGLAERLSHIDDEVELIKREEKQITNDRAEFQSQIKSFTAQIAQFENEKSQTEKNLSTLQSLLDSQKNHKNQAERELFELNSNLTMRLEKEKTLAQTLKLISDQLSDIHARIKTLDLERSQFYEQIERLEAELQAFETKKEETNHLLIERSVATEQVKRERNELVNQRNVQNEGIQITLKAISETKQKLHEFNLKQMQLNHQKDSISQGLQSRYRISLSDLNPADYQVVEEELEALNAQIEQLSEKLEAGGPVNLLAIDEYQELKGRYDFLLNQRRDLTEARDSLMEAIRKINRTTKKLFEETFVKVREAFQAYFRSLFGGGHADLILLDEENPIESGLDIIARPPGKKLQHISLLSGGEKALTAIALLLALFSVKPSPFCVLDEVDAPLDEANNDRFVKMLKPFLATTQFIIVTHSRKTIAMGDILYGVTMQEPGISKLVSVRLSKEGETIEHSDAKVATELNQILN